MGARFLSFWMLLVSVILALILSACGSQPTGPAQVVESLLQALVDKDEARYVSLTCADWEMDALIEYDAFSLVATTLDGLDCQHTGMEGDAALVTCQGRIQATYSNEIQTFDLSDRVYRVIPQSGDWLVCGYTR